MNMKIEDIEKAAIETAKKACDDFEEVFEFTNGFMVGAEWRINSVWHDAKEQPRRDTWYIAQVGDDGFDSFVDSVNWEEFARDLNIIRWAYIRDLLPNTEG